MKTVPDKLTSSELLELAQRELRCRGNGGALSWSEFHRRYGNPDNSDDAIRKRVERAEYQYPARNGGQGEATAPARPNHRETLIERFIQLLTEYMGSEKQEAKKPEPEPSVVIGSNDDTGAWEAWKKGRAHTTALLLFDLHIPDHDPQAIKLAVALSRVVEPDVIIVGGDICDFSPLGKYPVHPDYQIGDVLQTIQPVWDGVVSDLIEATSGAKLVAFRGNHEDRLYKFLARTGGQSLYQSVNSLFIATMRSNNRVWWLGDLQETHIGDLVIQHGERCGENAAKLALKDRGWSTNTVQGHAHRPQSWLHHASRADSTFEIKTGMVCGCLCQRPPHYKPYTPHSVWGQGVGVAQIGENVNLQNIIFQPTKAGGLEAWYGGERVVAAA